METNLKELCSAVEHIARLAGDFIRREREAFTLDRVEQKHAHDYVSDVDKNSERIIVEQLRLLIPDAGFVTEEGLATFGGEEYYWVVDPLDGTTNYIHGLSPYAVSIALCKGTSIEVGVVYDITADEMFSAYRGGGAWLNGKAIHASKQPLSQALLVIELPYNADAYAPLGLHLISTLYGNVGGIRMSGSAAISMCHVGAGRIDGWLEKYIGRYDYMAAALIVMEAGGCVTDFSGSTSFTMGDNIVATNGCFHDEMLRLVQM